MACSECGDKPKKDNGFTKAVVEINNETLILFRKVVIPASMGDESEFPAEVGKFRNVLLVYSANGHAYLYSSDGIPTQVTTSTDELERLIGQLRSDLTDESNTRENADRILQQEITDLKNSPDVVDIVATYAALMAYDTSGLGDKDIIRVLTDETHDDKSTYYRWNLSSQTWTYIGAIEGYYTKAQIDTMLAGKQDVLTAGSNITISSNVISATDTTYTAGSGLDLTGTAFSVDTNTIATKTDLDGKQDILTAGDNITIEDESGALVINATDTTYSAFSGADGTNAGSAGLVPAPAATDNTKYLKGDGTWGDAGSSYTAGDGIDITNDIISATNTGKARMLTTADYNYPANNPDRVAMWLMPNGLYVKPSNDVVTVRTAYSTSSSSITQLSNARIIIKSDPVLVAISGYDGFQVQINSIGSTYTPHYFLYDNSVINNLTSTSTTAPLSANQGKVLKDLIDSLIISGAGAPTTSTAGTVGQLYQDTTNGDLYICTDATNPYTWEEVGAGGGGPTVVQTTGTSTTDVMSQNATTGMVFADPSTKRKIAIGDNAQAGGSSAVAAGRYASASGESSIALGLGAQASVRGQFDVGLHGTWASYGYNSSNYRLLTGLYDPQNAHDAATKGYVDTALDGKQDTLTAGEGITIEDESGALVISATGGGGGGGMIELPASGYNWPSGSPDGIALWTLDPGVYYLGTGAKAYYSASGSSTAISDIFIVGETDTNRNLVQIIMASTTNSDSKRFNINATTGSISGSGNLITNIVQGTGTSTTDAMSQNAVTGMVYADPATKFKPRIGAYADAKGSYSVAIGAGAKTTSAGVSGVAIGGQSSSDMNTTVSGEGGIAIGTKNTASGIYSIALGGYNVTASGAGSIAFGAGASATQQGEMSIGTNNTNYGYNNSNYRLLTGLYDGQSPHDAATVGQLDEKQDLLTPGEGITIAEESGALVISATGGGGGVETISSQDWSALWQ